MCEAVLRLLCDGCRSVVCFWEGGASKETPRQVKEEASNKKSKESNDKSDPKCDGSESVCGQGFVDVLCVCLCGDPVTEEWDGDDAS